MVRIGGTPLLDCAHQGIVGRRALFLPLLRNRLGSHYRTSEFAVSDFKVDLRCEAGFTDVIGGYGSHIMLLRVPVSGPTSVQDPIRNSCDLQRIVAGDAGERLCRFRMLPAESEKLKLNPMRFVATLGFQIQQIAAFGSNSVKGAAHESSAPNFFSFCKAPAAPSDSPRELLGRFQEVFTTAEASKRVTKNKVGHAKSA
jgi:hypothetical protein